MSIQRWIPGSFVGLDGDSSIPHPAGFYVTYEDHIAEVDAVHKATMRAAQEFGWDAAVTACIEAVEALDAYEFDYPYIRGAKISALLRDRVIDALQEVQP